MTDDGDDGAGGPSARATRGGGASRRRRRAGTVETGAPVATIVGVAVFLVVLAGFLVWMFTAGGVTPEEKAIRELDSPVAPLPKGDPPALAAAGRELYERNCVSCHGSRLSGGSSGINLRAKRYTPPRWEDQDLANTIFSGRGDMPAFRGKVSAGELAGLVAYIRWEQGVPFGGADAAPTGGPPAGSPAAPSLPPGG